MHHDQKVSKLCNETFVYTQKSDVARHLRFDTLTAKRFSLQSISPQWRRFQISVKIIERPTKNDE